MRRLAAAVGFGALALGGGSACEHVDHWVLGTAAGGGGAGGASPSRLAALADMSACAAELYADADAAAAALEVAASDWYVDPSEEHRLAVQAAWRAAIGLWQQAELLRVGPAGPVSLPSGQALRDEIYSWPLVNRCLVEQTLVSQTYQGAAFPSTSLVNQRGLWALEYLAFQGPGPNACSPSASINATGAWAALDVGELALRKAAYGHVVAADVAARVSAVRAGWDGGFTAALGSASGFASDQMALNALSDGLFYVDLQVKDGKLGKPLGLNDCAAARCPEAVESAFAGAARDHVRNNLVGFRRVFAGCDAHPVAFDDLLVEMGAGELAGRVVADVDAAIALADGLADPTFLVDLAGDAAELVALREAVRKVGLALKTEVVTILDLELPKQLEGDND